MEEGPGLVRKGQGPLPNFLLVHQHPGMPPGVQPRRDSHCRSRKRKHFGELHSKGDCWLSKASKGQSGAGQEKEQGLLWGSGKSCEVSHTNRRLLGLEGTMDSEN